MIHIAILKPNYIDAVLAGTKTIESRLTMTAQPPFGQIQAGERLYLKASGGPFMATCIAQKVKFIQAQSPDDVDRVYQQYGKAIGGDQGYWQAKRACRFISLIRLSQVRPIAVGPPYKKAYMKAWYVLDEDRDPLAIARRLTGEG